MTRKGGLILTAVGPDRVGLVEQISEFIVRRDCNIEDSKMAVFEGEFALIVLISGQEQNLGRIAREHPELAAQTGLHTWVRTPSPRKVPESSLPYRLAAACMDHPAVVHKLSSTLSKLGVNIESMETKTYAAPVSGTPIFRMEAVISVPVHLNVNDLRRRFDEIQREENIDLELSLLTDLGRSA